MARQGQRPRRADSTSDEEWIGGRFPAPAYVLGDPPVRPDIVLWIADDLILGTEVARHEESLGAVARCLEKAMAQPMMGPSRKPSRIRVADAELATAVRAVVGDRVPVVVAPTPELDRVRAAMTDFMQSSPGGVEPRYLEDPELAPDTVGAFFLAAARLYRTQPWAHVPDDSALLAVSIPAVGVRRGCVSIIGGAGESYGVLLFDHVAGYLAMRQAGLGLVAAGGAPRTPGAAVFSVNFEPARELSPSMRREARQHHWSVAGPSAFPVVLAVDPDGVARPVRRDDVVRATALCEALARFFEAPANFRVAGAKRAHRRYALELAAPGATATVTYPHPDAPAGLGTLAELDDAAEALVASFLDEGASRGEDEVWSQTAALACGALVSFRAIHPEHQQGPWRADQVRSFLLEFVPAMVPVAGDHAARVPEVLRAFFGWMVREGHLDADEGARIDAIVRRHRAEYRRRAEDPSRWAPPKAAALSMMSRGVAPSDPRFLAALLGADEGSAPRLPPRPRRRRSPQETTKGPTKGARPKKN